MSIAEQLTRAKADLDAVYAAGKAAGSPKNRKEYSGTIDTEITGNTADDYAVLIEENDFLADENIRKSPMLFIRVECEFEEAIPLTIVRTWAGNAAIGGVPAAAKQLIYRMGSNAEFSAGSNNFTLYDSSVGSTVGQINITEYGELRLYSGSNRNYYIRPCTYKVIVEW